MVEVAVGFINGRSHRLYDIGILNYRDSIDNVFYLKMPGSWIRANELKWFEFLVLGNLFLIILY